MMKSIDVEFDADGFIARENDWSIELAEEMAALKGIETLTEDHWKVITRLRQHYFNNHQVPVMRQVCREAGLEEHCVSELLTDPRRAWQIAGLPNPGEEAKVYLETSELGD